MDTTRASARPVVGAWAAGWAGTVVVAIAWLLSPALGDPGEGLSWIFAGVLIVALYTLIPALVGLLLLLAPAVVGYRRTVPDWVVVVVATVVGGVAGQVLDLSVRTGALPALVGTTLGIAMLRVRSTTLRWIVAVLSLAVILALGRLVPLF